MGESGGGGERERGRPALASLPLLPDDKEALLSEGRSKSSPPLGGQEVGPSIPPSLPPSLAALAQDLGSEHLHVAEAEDEEEERLPPGADVLMGGGREGGKEGGGKGQGEERSEKCMG